MCGKCKLDAIVTDVTYVYQANPTKFWVDRSLEPEFSPANFMHQSWNSDLFFCSPVFRGVLAARFENQFLKQTPSTFTIHKTVSLFSHFLKLSN